MRGADPSNNFPEVLLRFPKGIQRASSSDVDPSVSNGGRGEALVIQLVHTKYLPVAGGLQDRHSTTLANQEDFVVGGYRRGEVLVDSALQTALFDHIAGRGIKRDQNPTVVNHVKHAFVQQCGRNLRNWFLI